METITSSITTTHLAGDWTIAGVVQQLPRLAQSEISGARPGGTVVIDCSGIRGIDHNGFQLLYVWLHCIQLRGLRPELVNLSGSMREAQERLGIKQLFENELKKQSYDMAGNRNVTSNGTH